MQLTFNTLQKATDANLQIFENYARTFTHVLRTSTSQQVETASIATGDLLAMIYVIPGYRQVFPQVGGGGGTTKWADIEERVDTPGIYYFQKPDPSLMAGVVFDTEEEFNEGWLVDETE